MRIDEATWAVVDVETTGLNPETDQIVEIGAVATSMENGALGMWATLVRPTIPIPPEVSAVHGITDAEVVNAPLLDEAMDSFAAFVGRFGAQPAFAAHNAVFDAAFLGLDKRDACPSFPILCTKRLAMHIWPSAPNHRNQTLRFWRKLNVETFGIAPHRALGDALVTGRLLLDEIETVLQSGISGGVDVDALVQFADSPILMDTLRFGNKHYGAPMSSVPQDYLQWMLRTVTDMGPDLKYSVEHELGQRRLARAS